MFARLQAQLRAGRELKLAVQQVLQEDAVGVEVQRGFAALAAQGEGFDGEVVAVAAQLRVKDGVFQRRTGKAGGGQLAADAPVLVVVAFRAQLQFIHRDAVDLSVQGKFEGDGVRAEGGEEKERQRGFCCPLAYCSAQYADKPRPRPPPPGEGAVWLFAGCGFPTLTAGDM